MITPSSIYWITRCDAIKELTAGLAIMSAFSAAAGLIVFIASLAYEEFCDRAEVEESVNGAISWLLSLNAD